MQLMLFVESMKRSESNQIVGYIFACCITLMLNEHILDSFAVFNSLNLLLRSLRSTEGVEFLRIQLCLALDWVKKQHAQ